MIIDGALVKASHCFFGYLVAWTAGYGWQSIALLGMKQGIRKTEWRARTLPSLKQIEIAVTMHLPKVAGCGQRYRARRHPHSMEAQLLQPQPNEMLWAGADR